MPKILAVLCDDALRTIIPQLQRQYDMQEW